MADRKHGGAEIVAAGAAGVPSAERSDGAAIGAFLAEVRAVRPRVDAARLIFALDATASRQPTWDRAQAIQAEMFEAAAAHAELAVQLVFFRGAGECRASRWVGEAGRLADLMARVDCRAGATQLERVLAHATTESRDRRVAALVFVGDSFEEDAGAVFDRAGALALVGTPCFLFQEGSDRATGRVFAEVARLTRGAHVPFDEGSAGRLAELLRAVATYAAGGRAALDAAAALPTGSGARLLIEAMK